MLYPVRHKTAGAKCLGTYEFELNYELEKLISTGYSRVINLGCAEGYYAVGFARRLPQARVLAVDYNPHELALCRTMAAANGISQDRIAFGLEASHDAIQAAVGGGALILADIEGWEIDVLDPGCTSALLDCDIVVELHEHAAPGVESTLRHRFSASHDIHAVDSVERSGSDWEGLPNLSARDRLLLLTERPFPMRWLVLTRRGGG
jgi:hypothetical protein